MDVSGSIESATENVETPDRQQFEDLNTPLTLVDTVKVSLLVFLLYAIGITACVLTVVYNNEDTSDSGV